MTIRTSRDWRGIKHQLNKYSTQELLTLINNAEHTREQVSDFVAHVATELGRRGVTDEPSAA